MYVSKQMRQPLKLLKAHVIAATEGKFPEGIEKTKYLIVQLISFDDKEEVGN